LGKIKTDELEERVGSAGITVNSTVKIDTIAEKTSANGVTIDGVSLKDGAVQNATLVGATLKDYAETDQDVTSATTLAIDLANGNTGSVTLAHNVTDIDFTNVPTNGVSTFALIVTQDGTGSRTMAINAVTVNGGSTVTAKTPAAGGLTLTTTAGGIDILTFIFKDASTPFLTTQLAFG